MDTFEPVSLLVGVALLLLGRRLYWVFVAGVGFLAGALVAKEALAAESPGMVLGVALVAGLVGALLSVALQYVALSVAGFLAGGYLFHALVQALGWGDWAWVGFLVGGVVGALLVLAMLDWALILLSTLVGATVIVQNVPLEAGASGLLFLVLSVVGVLVQARQVTARPKAA